MTIKELRGLAKACGRKIQVKTYSFEGRESRKSIKIIPSFPEIFFDEDSRLAYIANLNDTEKKLFNVNIDIVSI